jgi:uncharacterized protein
VKVQVVCATAGAQDCVALELPEGATAEDAIRHSGLIAAWKQDAAALVIALHGRVVAADARLAHGDRVELLRPVLVDPKDVRRRRAALRSSRKADPSGSSAANR